MNFIWEKLPPYIRWPILISLVAFVAPIKLYDGAKTFVSGQVMAITVPIEEKRQIEIRQIREDIATIKQDTRDIKNHLMARGK
jgi:hypothetical protein